MSKVLIGSITIKKDTQMFNGQFQYAASFEELLVPAGEYPIYTDEADLRFENGTARLGWRNYIGYEGTVIRGNVGGKQGDRTRVDEHIYDYELAKLFLDGHDKNGNEYTLFDNWYLTIRECHYEGKRLFAIDIIKKGE